MIVVNKFHKASFVSVMNAALLDISFVCHLFNVTRLSLCKSVENVNRQCTFLHEDKQTPPTDLCPAVQEISVEQSRRIGR